MKKTLKKIAFYLCCTWFAICWIIVLLLDPVIYHTVSEMSFLELFIRMSAALPFVIGMIYLLIEP